MQRSRGKDNEAIKHLAEQGSQLLAMENTITLLADKLFNVSDRYIKKYGDERQRERTKLPFFSANRRSFGTWLGATHTHQAQAGNLKKLSIELKEAVKTIHELRTNGSKETKTLIQEVKNLVLEKLSAIYNEIDQLGGGTLESKLGNVNTLGANVIFSLDPQLNKAAKAVEQVVIKGVLGVFLSEETDLQNKLKDEPSFTALPIIQQRALVETYGKLNSPDAIRTTIDSLRSPSEERKKSYSP